MTKETPMFSPRPEYESNLTDIRPQPMKDHNELIAEKEAAARAYLSEVAKEYSEWVAREDIFTVDMILIYREGVPIPISNVKLHGYDKTGQAVRVKK